MSPEKQHEKALFEAALDLTDSSERGAFLDRACGADTALRVRLEKLLSSQEAAEALLTLRPQREPEVAPSGGPASTTDDGMLAETNVHIGRYKLLQRLGEGGCGVVYLAEQQEPVQREVALKIIRMGVGTPNIIARFQMEQQAMAWMEHPNIARVLDAGATDTGRPYFVMERVRGTKITDYCNEHRLDINHRLDLFVQVCNAIQHAHQKGVIHRDIKPSNILVALHDGQPVPKVIDFGISKSIEEASPENTEAPARARFIGTPAYMSPEQAEPEERDVDTRSDIYGLGALLYELLTGRPPFGPQGLDRSDPEAVRRAIRERPAPPPPSALVASLPPEEATNLAGQRSTSPRALIAALRNDLDYVVMRALEKDRQRRYETAHGLARDIRRYLDHEPVVARPPSRMYHFQKLVSRNRVAFAAIGAVSAALIAGFIVSSWLFFREREAHREAEQARRAESALRTASEARANIARAAYLLSRGRAEEADALVEKIPISINEPSLEAAHVYRALADWNLRQNRWKTGARRLLDLIHANQMDKTDMSVEATRDSLTAGPALVFAGNLEDYHRLVQETISRFGGTQRANAAEQVLKLSLILPTDAETLRSLEPVTNIARKSMETERATPENNYLLAWRAFAIALFEYRAGHFDDAVAMARKCLSFSNAHPPAIAMAHLVMGMALRQLHQEPDASSEIRAGEAMVRSKIPIDAPIPSQFWGNEFWYDWIFAQLLLNEADAQAASVH